MLTNTNIKDNGYDSYEIQKEYTRWYPKTQTYEFFSPRRGYNKLYNDIDFKALCNGKKSYMAAVLILLSNTKGSNCMICRHDANNRHWREIKNEDELMELLDMKKRTWLYFKKDVVIPKALIMRADISYGTIKTKRFYINPYYTNGVDSLAPDLYLLFHDFLDTVLSPERIRDLRHHLDEEMTRLTFPEKEENKDERNEEFINIFNEYIFNFKKPSVFQLTKNQNGYAMIKRDTPNKNDDQYFHPNAVDAQRKVSKKDVSECTTCYLDFDAGTNPFNGRYYPMTEVSKRKKDMLKVICSFPDPTAVVETRNGFHVYYAIDPISQKDWQALQNVLIDTARISDPACKDAARLLRIPESKWVKASKNGNYEPYDVHIIDANYIRYDASDLMSLIKMNSDIIKKATNSYVKKYGAVSKKEKNIVRMPNAVKKDAAVSFSFSSISVPEYIDDDQKARLNDIASLSTNTFDVPKESTNVDHLDITSYLKKKDLANFLLVSSDPSSFNCIFHNDEHPSAAIFDNDEKGFKYYCNAQDNCDVDPRGWDIFDCVMNLSGCSFVQAEEYLTKVYNILIV